VQRADRHTARKIGVDRPGRKAMCVVSLRVRRELWLYVVLSGCGFHSSSAPTDASPIDVSDAAVHDAAIPGSSDASADAATDAMAPPATCWQRWLDHSVVLQAPAALTALSTLGSERDPWISDDGLRLYFARQAVTGTFDVYLATRPNATEPFTSADKLDGLSLGDRDEGRVSLTRDELVIAVASNLGGASQFDVRIATRTSRTHAFTTPTLDHLTSVNTASTQHFDPFLSGDGLRLYLAPVPNGGAQHLAIASRAAIGSDFTPVALLAVVNTTEPAGADADPALSPDERVLLFTSNRSGGEGNNDLYYATRASAGLPFTAPVPIPTVNTASADGDPMLTSDGCTLYFSSKRSGNLDLYTATVAR
jgi:WD40-like Beta Propeller Repeat